MLLLLALLACSPTDPVTTPALEPPVADVGPTDTDLFPTDADPTDPDPAPVDERTIGVSVGDLAANITLMDQDGVQHDLWADYAGNVVVLDFSGFT